MKVCQIGTQGNTLRRKIPCPAQRSMSPVILLGLSGVNAFKVVAL